MKKNLKTIEGYFSFNTPTGSLVNPKEPNETSTMPTFNDFACMPESQQTKKVERDTQESDPTYF